MMVEYSYHFGGIVENIKVVQGQLNNRSQTEPT
jgi:hypothetical protein